MRAAVEPSVLRALITITHVRDASTSGHVRNVSADSDELGSLISRGIAPHGHGRRRVTNCHSILSTVRRDRSCVPVAPGIVLRLRHSLFQRAPLAFTKRFGSDSGIVVRQSTRKADAMQFTPPSTLIAPRLVRHTYSTCARTVQSKRASPLLTVTVFVLSFAYVRPFGSNGNHVDQLLALLVLCHGNCVINGCVDVRRLVRRDGDACCRTLTTDARK